MLQLAECLLLRCRIRGWRAEMGDIVGVEAGRVSPLVWLEVDRDVLGVGRWQVPIPGSDYLQALRGEWIG